MKAEAKVSSDELASEPSRYLVSTRGTYRVTKLFEKVGIDHVVLVWSMWRGYWERNSRLCAWSERSGVVPQFIHSGGHAWPEDLRRLVEAIGAKKTIWVHTDSDDPEREAFMNSEAPQQP
jgi:mRNA degradation ribonuclease J1/J2